MKTNKRDLHNLGCLKLAEMGVWTDDECLAEMNWGRMTKKRTQERYLARLCERLASINMQEPGLIEEMFTKQGKEKLKDIAEQHNLNVLDPVSSLD